MRGQGQKVYFVVKLGHNPLKTTSVQLAPANTKASPVVWNECLDFDVRMTDDSITIQLMHFDPSASDDVVGTAMVPIDDFFDKEQRKELSRAPHLVIVRGKPYHMKFKENNAGIVWLSFLVTPEGQKLPSVVPDFEAGEAALPLMNEF